MPRSVNSVASKARRKKVLSRTRGFWGARKNVLSIAKNALDKSLAYAFVGRRLKKRDYRTLWIARINAACRSHNISYSIFIHKLTQAGIEINRKVLADLALNNPDAFTALVKKVA